MDEGEAGLHFLRVGDVISPSKGVKMVSMSCLLPSECNLLGFEGGDWSLLILNVGRDSIRNILLLEVGLCIGVHKKLSGLINGYNEMN